MRTLVLPLEFFWTPIFWQTIQTCYWDMMVLSESFMCRTFLFIESTYSFHDYVSHKLSVSFHDLYAWLQMIYIQKILGKCSFWCKTHPAVGRARDISVFWWLVVTLRCTSCFMVWDYIIQRCWAWLLEYGFPTSDCVVYFVSELVLR